MAIVFHENLTFNSYTIINYEKTADKILEDTPLPWKIYSTKKVAVEKWIDKMPHLFVGNPEKLDEIMIMIIYDAGAKCFSEP